MGNQYIEIIGKELLRIDECVPLVGMIGKST